MKHAVWVTIQYTCEKDEEIRCSVVSPIAGPPNSGLATPPGGVLELYLGEFPGLQPGQAVEVQTSITGGTARVDAGLVPEKEGKHEAFLLSVNLLTSLVPGPPTDVPSWDLSAIVAGDMSAEALGVHVTATPIGGSGSVTLSRDFPQGQCSLGRHTIAPGTMVEVVAQMADQEVRTTWVAPDPYPDREPQPKPEPEPEEPSFDPNDASWWKWGWNVATGTIVEAGRDVIGVPGEAIDAMKAAGKRVYEEVTDWENWVVGGETLKESGEDLVNLILQDRETGREVSITIRNAGQTVASVVEALWRQAWKDPTGSAAGLLKVLLGADNMPKVIDKKRGLLNRLGWVAFIAVDTGSTLYGMGAGAKVLGGRAVRLVKGGDKLTDGVKAATHPRPRPWWDDPPTPPVAKGRDAGLRNLKPGQKIPDDIIPQTGYTQHQIDEIARVAADEGVVVGARTTNMDSTRHIAAGTGTPKPVTIKSKTIQELDTYIGASKGDEGLVGYFRPTEPDLPNVPEHLRDAVQKRYELRKKEFGDLREDVNKMIQKGEVVEKDGKLWRAVDGKPDKPFAGDIDPVYIKDAKTGMPLTGDRYLAVLEKLKKSGGQLQHGAEVNMVNDLLRNATPGTPAYKKAMEKAIALANKLEANHVDFTEVVVEITKGGARRGPNLTHLPMAV